MPQVEGDSGRDTLFPVVGQPTELLGKESNDTLFAGNSNDTLDGGMHRDWALYSTLLDGTPLFLNGVNANLATGIAIAALAGSEVSQVLREIENLEGSESNDTLSGDAGANEIQGRRGDDSIFGDGGSDTIFPGSGNDTLRGGDGDDNLYASIGNATISGDEGIDRLLFTTTIEGRPVFGSGVTVDFLVGVATATVDGQSYRYLIQEIEEVIGSSFADVLTGNTTHNVLLGASGDDLINGLAGNDTLFSGDGADTLAGGIGDDSLYASLGNGTLIGETGEDRILFSTTRDNRSVFNTGVLVELKNNRAEARLQDGTYFYELDGVEHVDGSPFGDTLIGDEGANEIQGLSGDDEISGLDGEDTIYAGSGADILSGGGGDDSLYAGLGNATINGGDDIDTVLFSAIENGGFVFSEGVLINFEQGIASAEVSGVFSRFILENIEGAHGSDSADRIVGDRFDNTLFGRGGDDTLQGGAGDDALIGGAGTDVAIYEGDSDHFTIRYDAVEDQTYIIDRTDAEGTDTFGTNILRFADTDFTLVADGARYFGDTALGAEDFTALVELYIAYFNRAPDAIGLNFWTLAFLNGTSLDEAAGFFFDQPETRALYGNQIDPGVFVNAVYENVLGRGADDVGLGFWEGALRDGTVTEGQFIRDFLQGARAEAPPGASADFVAQQNADRAYLDAKTDIGINFAAIRGMSDVNAANTVMGLFDGSDASLQAARDAADAAYEAALETDGSGSFLVQLIGVVDDPFA